MSCFSSFTLLLFSSGSFNASCFEYSSNITFSAFSLKYYLFSSFFIYKYYLYKIIPLLRYIHSFPLPNKIKSQSMSLPLCPLQPDTQPNFLALLFSTPLCLYWVLAQLHYFLSPADNACILHQVHVTSASRILLVSSSFPIVLGLMYYFLYIFLDNYTPRMSRLLWQS